MNLDAQEIDTLIDALEVWQKKPADDAAFGGLFGTVLGALTKADLEERRAAVNADLNEAAEKSKARADIATLLKAKLIMERQRMQRECLTRLEGK